MIARARVVVEPDGRGGSRLACLRSTPPLALRVAEGSVYLVGTAAGPLGGDEVHVELDVGAGCQLTVRTSAAAVVLPGATPSRTTIAARVGPDAVLEWLPEPTVAAGGCRHRVRTGLTLAPGARLEWREELVLGRHGERPGAVSSRLAVDLAGLRGPNAESGLRGPNAESGLRGPNAARPLLRTQLDVGGQSGGWDGPAVVAGARAVGGVVVVDPAWEVTPPAAQVVGDGVAVLPLAGPGAQVVALAADALELRRLLDEGVRMLRPRHLTELACSTEYLP